jgi:glycosyltransferase involved in cell wall biosynthesis
MNVFFVSDQKIDWLGEEFVKQGMPIEIVCPLTKTNINKEALNMFRIHRILYLHTKYLKLANQVLAKSKKDDIIICWLDVIAIYILLLSKLFGRRRKIIAINIMFNDNPSIITRIKKWSMRRLLSNKNIYPTVTSVSLSQFYQNIFNLPAKDFFVLHDTYGTRRKKLQNREYKTENVKYVFCGGTNGRDWDTLIKIAEQLPDLKFVIVGPHKDTLGEDYPSNIDYHYNIPYDKFIELLVNSTLLALPLNTEAPAGLIVLLEGALLSKAIVTTDNITMRAYISSGNNGYLVGKGDYKEFAGKISEVFSNEQIKKSFGEKLNQAIIEKCSPETYVKDIIGIVHQISEKQVL